MSETKPIQLPRGKGNVPISASQRDYMLAISKILIVVLLYAVIINQGV